jgi:hypothetical protein
MDHIQVEATSKPLKLAQIIVVLVALASVSTGLYLQGDRGLWVGGIGLSIAFFMHLIVRLLMWWEHG